MELNQGAVHHHEHDHDGVLEEPPSAVAAFYGGRSVLVTGATGFMGKVLVEKLVRACPGLGAVFVLVRAKKGVCAEDRLRDVLATPAFDALRRQRPDALAKVKAVAGDVSLPGLGLSEADRAALAEAVSVVFHLAATVRFDEPLRKAATINVQGAEAVLELCRGLPKLVTLVHVSTAYAACTRRVVLEAVYPPPMTAAQLHRELHVRDDDAVARDTASLLGGFPNTYTFTKAIAEAVVLEKGKGLPIVIIRPSIVSPSLSEPMPGWVDNWNGPVGPWVSIGKGMMGSVFGRPEAVADFVPVDVCINIVVAAAWDAHSRPGVTVYNCVSGASNPVTWGGSTDLWVRSVRRRPYASALGAPGTSFTTSRALHCLRTLTGQLAPAYAMDAAARLGAGKSPGLAALVWKQYGRMHALEFFTTNEFAMRADNADRLWARMSAADRRLCPYAELATLDWGRYFDGVLEGTKAHLLREVAVGEDPAEVGDGADSGAASPQARIVRTSTSLLRYALAVPLLAASVTLLTKPRSKL